LKQSAALAAWVLRATTKKGRQLFSGKKLHLRENPGYAYAPLGAQLLWPQYKMLATPLTQGDLI